MPTEIADSDGESELNSPRKVEQLLPSHPAVTQQSPANNDFGVHFSDFLSQEQQLHEEWRLRSPNLQQPTNHMVLRCEEASSGIGDNPAREEHLTQHALTAVHDGGAQSKLATVEMMPTMSRKRRHTTQDNGDDAGGPDQLSPKRQRKSRTKTYETSSDRMKSSQTQGPSDAAGGTTHAWQVGVGPGDTPEHGSFLFALVENQAASEIDMPMQPPPTANTRAIEVDESPRQRNRPRRVLSLLEESIYDAPREISTSRSSMGNYESINIDFRSTANGRDISVNPFGSLLPTSVEDEFRDPDQEKMAAQFGFDNLSTSTLFHANTLNPVEVSSDPGRWNGYGGVDDDGPHEPAGESRSIDPMALYNDLPNDIQLLSSPKASSRRSQKSVSRTSMSPAVETDASSLNRLLSDSGLVSTKQSAKKRGRKPKNQHLLSESLDHLQEDEEEEEEPDLSDNLFIGLPREQYKPRPSRSRAATNEIAPTPTLPDFINKKREAPKDEQSSPMKQSNNELNLSDEAFIGLPKDNYKPRPSRSRSKRTTLEDVDTSQPEIVEAAGEVQLSSTVVLNEATATPLKKLKKPTKMKVKRAKTSAAALLKKSEAMLSEGEEDVLWLETKPIEVKLDLPADIKREVGLGQKEIPATHSDSGREEAAVRRGVDNEKGLEKKQQDEDTTAASPNVEAAGVSAAIGNPKSEETTTYTTHIVVDIPLQATRLAQVEPKRRGRKKKCSEVLQDHEVDLEGPSHSSDTAPVTGVSELPERASADAAQLGAKKRGRKKKAIEIATEKDDVDENTELASDAPPSDENAHNGSRPALAEKDLNHPVPHPVFKNSTHTSSEVTHDASAGENENRSAFAATHLDTPHKQASKQEDSTKGPTRHSPINPSGGKAPYRVGLSKRAAIPSLLRIVRKDVGKPNEKERPQRRPESRVPVEDED